MKNSLFIILVTLLSACQLNGQDSGSEYQIIDQTEFQNQLNQTDNPQLIDVRTAAEYQAGFIPGAMNYDLLNGDFEKQISTFSKKEPVFVYCAKGGRSNRAALLLKEKGFKKIYDLKGGFSSWKTPK